MPFTKGHKSYLLKQTPEAREKIRLSKIGNKNPMFGKIPWNKGIPHLVGSVNPAWKGNNVTKESMHAWVRNNFKKSGVCEHCKESKKTEWSNKDHKYDSKDRERWQEICRGCHQSYDYKYLGRTKSRVSRIAIPLIS